MARASDYEQQRDQIAVPSVLQRLSALEGVQQQSIEEFRQNIRAICECLGLEYQEAR